MRKLGIYLIGILFLLQALSDLIALITGTHSPTGFMGITYVIPYQFDVMGWVGVLIQAYVGFCLLRLDNQGRIWALVVLWPAVILSGLFLVILIISSVLHLSLLTSISWTLNIFNKSLRIDGPVIRFLLSAIFFLFYTVQVCLLTSRDVKMEFQKQEYSKEIS
ncbi:MAG: hypothetical protein H7Y59_09445 [Anaerolineales bacterium]|nr:hypothetical protein [Anaerolineales bacterium]